MDREAATHVARKRFGDYLTGLRREAGLTQRAVGEQANLSATLISQIESGRRNATDDALKLLAGVYGVRARDLRVLKDAFEAVALLQASGVEVTLNTAAQPVAHVDLRDQPDPHQKWKAPKAGKTFTYPWLAGPTPTRRDDRALRRDLDRDIESLPTRHIEKVRAFVAGLKAADTDTGS